MFYAFANKGFQVTFANGWKVSVMFGAGNYCQNRFEDVDHRETVPVWGSFHSDDAEVAVFTPDDEFSTDFPGCPEGDQVLGWITPETMLEIMNWTANQRG
jgi:hypothetical protein